MNLRVEYRGVFGGVDFLGVFNRGGGFYFEGSEVVREWMGELWGGYG